AGEVIGVARITVVREVVMNAKVRPAIGIRRSGGLIAAQTLTTAACVEKDGKKGAAGTVIKNHRVAEGVRKRALTIALGKAGKGGTAIGGNRRSGDVDRIGGDTPRIVVRDDDYIGIIGTSRNESL